MRYVSGTLAFPGLKPQATPNPYLPTADATDAEASITDAANQSVQPSPNAQ